MGGVARWLKVLRGSIFTSRAACVARRPFVPGQLENALVLLLCSVSASDRALQLGRTLCLELKGGCYALRDTLAAGGGAGVIRGELNWDRGRRRIFLALDWGQSGELSCRTGSDRSTAIFCGIDCGESMHETGMRSASRLSEIARTGDDVWENGRRPFCPFPCLHIGPSFVAVSFSARASSMQRID